jgi:catechol 2,3-dioxygenase-like lactoylglutathione lyase family enzyme
MSRLQLALNVDDVDTAVAFYSTLFGTEPAKRRPGYANFAIADPPLKLVLLENPGQGGSLNHLGVEVESTDRVDAEQTRLAAAGLASVDERGTTCCYAKQDKFWVEGAPHGEQWEVYAVLADDRPDLEGVADLELREVAGDGTCCADAAASADSADPAKQAAAACC